VRRRAKVKRSLNEGAARGRWAGVRSATKGEWHWSGAAGGKGLGAACAISCC